LKRWLAEPAEEPVRLKDEWFVKVLVQVLVAPGQWRELVGGQRQSALRRLAALQDVRDDPATPPLTELVVEGAMFQVEAGLRWLEACEERLAEVEERGGSGKGNSGKSNSSKRERR
jgi:hypothetical protein